MICLALFAAALTLRADEAGKKDAAKGDQMVVTTGSHLKQTVPRVRYYGPAVTPSPLYIIDRDAIERSGASTLSQVLRRSTPGR